MRVRSHPILGPLPPRRTVTIFVNGRPIRAREGEPIAAAMLANGLRLHRFSEKRGQPRGVFCARGQCTDCAMTVNGRSNVRTCVTPVREGMQVATGGARDERTRAGASE
ncbi:MAG: (2Fe-2S)-binding protein, partial [Armatimonadota bacterium]